MAIQRILLVEDEPDVREITAKILKSHGFDVSTASTGKEAIALAATEPIDAVLVDLGLPDMSGREVVQALQHYPVAILTGRDADVVIPGTAMVLQKPLHVKQLVEAVRILLSTAGNIERSA